MLLNLQLIGIVAEIVRAILLSITISIYIGIAIGIAISIAIFHCHYSPILLILHLSLKHPLIQQHPKHPHNQTLCFPLIAKHCPPCSIYFLLNKHNNNHEVQIR